MRLITFEGIDGSGKTIVSKMCHESLQRVFPEIRFGLHRDPETSAPEIKAIREELLDPKSKLTPVQELRMYIQARRLLIDLMRDTYGPNDVVLCDRFVHSTYAYQGYGRRIRRPIIQKIHRELGADLMPDLTLWFDVPLRVARMRQRKRGDAPDRMESQSLEFFQRIEQGYAELATNTIHTNPMVRLDASVGLSDVHQMAMSKIVGFLM